MTVLVGDNPKCHTDVEYSLNLGVPVIVLEGSPLSNAVAQHEEPTDGSLDD